MTTETVLTVLVLPLCLAVLLVGWLCFYTRGGRPISLNLKGLGIEVSISSPQLPSDRVKE